MASSDLASVVVATAYGGPEVLSVIERPVGTPGPGEARIEVRAAGVNPIDYKVYSGTFGADPTRLPMPLGSEVSGVVAQGVDAALDFVGTDEAVDVSLELVPDRARIATIAAGGRGGQVGIKSLGGGPGSDPGTEIRTAARPELARLAAQASLRVFVSQTFPLAGAAEAHQAIKTGHAEGKIVLIP